MPITQPLPLLGGLSPRQFMERHWQRKPLLVRAAVADLEPLLSRAELFDLAARDEVAPRLAAAVQARLDAAGARRGPARRRRPCADVAVPFRCRRPPRRPDDQLGE